MRFSMCVLCECVSALREGGHFFKNLKSISRHLDKCVDLMQCYDLTTTFELSTTFPWPWPLAGATDEEFGEDVLLKPCCRLSWRLWELKCLKLLKCFEGLNAFCQMNESSDYTISADNSPTSVGTKNWASDATINRFILCSESKWTTIDMASGTPHDVPTKFFCAFHGMFGDVD